MRGPDEQTQHMFSYLSPEQRVPADHPLRAIRALTDEALRSMSAQLERLYSTTGRPSIPPEQLLRALLLQVLYTVRSERLLMEELDYNLLFGGSSACTWTTRSGTRRRLRRIGTGCWAVRLPRHSSTRSVVRPAQPVCSPTSTSPWTARSWKPGRA